MWLAIPTVPPSLATIGKASHDAPGPPTDAAVSRKRRLSKTSSALSQSAKRSRTAPGSCTTVNVSPAQKVSQFPGEHNIVHLAEGDSYAQPARWKLC